MIISHENEFIFFKPLKSAGSSVEFALGNHCGKNDILTGSPYRDEIEKGYKDSNNEIISRLVGQQARNYLINEKGSFNPPPHTLLSDFYINVITEIYNTHTTPIRFFEQWIEYATNGPLSKNARKDLLNPNYFYRR